MPRGALYRRSRDVVTKELGRIRQRSLQTPQNAAGTAAHLGNRPRQGQARTTQQPEDLCAFQAESSSCQVGLAARYSPS